MQPAPIALHQFWHCVSLAKGVEPVDTELEEATRPNLDKTCGEVLQEGDEVTVTDAGLPFQLTLLIKLE